MVFSKFFNTYNMLLKRTPLKMKILRKWGGGGGGKEKGKKKRNKYKFQ
jgi:hypothetical protein